MTERGTRRARSARWRRRWRDLFADTRPLRQPDYRRLWLANIVTVVGAQLTVVVVPAQIYSITGSSAYVGLTGMFGLVPLVVFGLWGGALADAFDRAHPAAGEVSARSPLAGASRPCTHPSSANTDVSRWVGISQVGSV